MDLLSDSSKTAFASRTHNVPRGVVGEPLVWSPPRWPQKCSKCVLRGYFCLFAWTRAIFKFLGHVECWVLGAGSGCRALGAGCWALGAGVLGTGRRVPGAGCWALGCWVPGDGTRVGQRKIDHIKVISE